MLSVRNEKWTFVFLRIWEVNWTVNIRIWTWIMQTAINTKWNDQLYYCRLLSHENHIILHLQFTFIKLLVYLLYIITSFHQHSISIHSTYTKSIYLFLAFQSLFYGLSLMKAPNTVKLHYVDPIHCKIVNILQIL